MSNAQETLGAFREALARRQDLGERMARATTTVLVADSRDEFTQRALAGACSGAHALLLVDQSDQPGEHLGRPVLSLKEMAGLDPATTLVCLGARHQRLLAGQLSRLGFTDFADVRMLCNDRFGGCYDAALLEAHAGEIGQVMALLEDDASRQAYLGLLLHRLTLNPLCVPIPSYPEYLHPCVQPCPGDTVIDGGGFDGDSAELILRYTRGLIAVIVFEPDPASHARLEAFIRSRRLEGRVRAEPLGLWDRAGRVGFASGGGLGSRIAEASGTQSIAVLDLDTYCARTGIAPGFIKLDVEGAEVRALRGCSGVVSRLRPRIAACIYHEPRDLWEVPLTIASQGADYAFFVGHHNLVDTHWGSVVYAAPRERLGPA